MLWRGAGRAEVKFDKKEMEYVIANLDLAALDQELERVTPVMQAVEQDPNEARVYIHSALPKALEPVSQTHFYLNFLASPTQILGDENGQVCGLEVEETRLVRTNGDTKARRHRRQAGDERGHGHICHRRPGG